ncbi:lantibiotic dehydratase C-terminal domain-containing protein [Luethyella okanaganae]|uniref:Lantibiotic dehydratase C-terminal domain-containing protein n=1 Tax=Luethyella okanaganae TaxID=69372 RepID=A0ABW1VDJ7_9MICO
MVRTTTALWYFLRYWDGGPHLRVRLSGASEVTLSALAQRWRTNAEVGRVVSTIARRTSTRDSRRSP